MSKSRTFRLVAATLLLMPTFTMPSSAQDDAALRAEMKRRAVVERIEQGEQFRKRKYGENTAPSSSIDGGSAVAGVALFLGVLWFLSQMDSDSAPTKRPSH